MALPEDETSGERIPGQGNSHPWRTYRMGGTEVYRMQAETHPGEKDGDAEGTGP